MDKEKFFYNTQTYNVTKAFLYALPTLIILVAFVMIFARYIHSEAFAVIGWILICSVPWFVRRVSEAFSVLVNRKEFPNSGKIIRCRLLESGDSFLSANP